MLEKEAVETSRRKSKKFSLLVLNSWYGMNTINTEAFILEEVHTPEE